MLEPVVKYLAPAFPELSYNGVLAAVHEVAGRRLNVTNIGCVDHKFKPVVNPEDIVTWIDISKSEELAYKESA